jgi:hypothetical protein
MSHTETEMNPNRLPMRAKDSALNKSLEVIRSLIHGADPATGAELPSDSVINRVDVARALLVAEMAIQNVIDRTARRAQLPSGIGRPWSPEEELALRDEFKGDLALQEIANRHRRTVRAIEARLERLGLITPDQRTTSSSFPASSASSGSGRRSRKTTERE